VQSAVPTQSGLPIPPPPAASALQPPPAPSKAKVTYSAPAPPPRAFVRGPEPASTVEYAPDGNRGGAAARVREPRARADLFGGSGASGNEDELLRSESVPLSQYDEKPTGARNESSVLFSLDTLKAGARRGTPSSAPPKAAAAAPPTAADILGMSAGGALPGLDSSAALLSAPVVDARPVPPSRQRTTPPIGRSPVPPPAAAIPDAYAPRARMDTTPPMSRGRPKPAVIAGVVVAAIVVFGAAALVFKDRFLSSPPAPTAEAPTAAPERVKPQPVEPIPTTTVAAAETPAPPAETAAPAPAPEAKQPETKQVAGPRTPAPATPAPRAASTPKSDTNDALKAAIKSDDKPKSDMPEKVVLAEDPPPAADPSPAEAPPPVEEKPPFDAAAAKAALASAAGSAANCKSADGPTGSGKVQVTFAPSGKATSANITEGDFAGTSVGSCVAKLFRGAKVPAFSGDPVTVSKSFSIPE
jgi:hypothetical protein